MSLKVHLIGGDGHGWALDADLGQLRQALAGAVTFTSLEDCEVVHSVWWEALLNLPADALLGKRVICHFSGEPFRYLGLPRFARVRELVGCWVCQSTQAREQMTGIGIDAVTIPYTVDTTVFHRLPPDAPSLRKLKRDWNIPAGRYLIGSFHRDTEGFDLLSPKLTKGPDIFAAILAGLARRGLPVHAVLAGPRRMWLRHRLAELGVPFSFIGQQVANDDLKMNILEPETVNRLYNLLDLYLVSSRSEGGPRTILEALAAGCQVASTPVGVAPDILPPQAIFRAVDEAVAVITHAMSAAGLRVTDNLERELLLARHTAAAVAPLFRQLYENIHTVPVCSRQNQTRYQLESATLISRVASRLGLRRKKELTVGLWHNFVPAPYGGGNQFMTALRNEFRRQGINIVENRLHASVDAYLLNSVQFDVERFRRFSERRDVRVIHRIDGPIQLIRGFDRAQDDLCFELNQHFAGATIIQSAWTFKQLAALGYQPVSPVIIHNAVDSTFFHQRGRLPFQPKRRIRLISSSWSDNPRKGGALYKWLDEHLDWNRYEYTFVGRTAETFTNICHYQAVPSAELAALLREHDIYITASRNDPCSNAVLEALACGLPVLYLNDGGHPELVGFGGLPFTEAEEVPSLLERMVSDYESFQQLIAVPSLEDIAGRYLEVIRGVIDNG